MLFSALSTILWAVVYTSAGYLFGEVIKSQLGHIEDIEKYIIAVLVLMGITLVLVNRRKKTIPGRH